MDKLSNIEWLEKQKLSQLYIGASSVILRINMSNIDRRFNFDINDRFEGQSIDEAISKARIAIGDV